MPDVQPDTATDEAAGAAGPEAAGPEAQPAAEPAPDGTPEVAHGELVERGDEVAGVPVPVEEERREAVEEPAKVMRIGSMIKQLLEEVRSAELDGPARDRLKEIYDTSIQELGTALSPDLREELERVTNPFGTASAPSDAELRVAQAQLVGWLEGLFHGIQATLFAQQMAARNQLEDMRRQLGSGSAGAGAGPTVPGMAGQPGQPGEGDVRHGTYL